MEAISRKLDELHISIESIGHAPAMTADEQVATGCRALAQPDALRGLTQLQHAPQMQALGDLADTCTKNLFLQVRESSSGGLLSRGEQLRGGSLQSTRLAPPHPAGQEGAPVPGDCAGRDKDQPEG